MTTSRQLRKAALSLPEVTEERAGRSGNATTFAVGRREFARLADGVVHLLMGAEDAATTVRDIPAAVQVGDGVRVALDDVNGMQLNALVGRSWTHRAPRRLTEAASSAGAAAEQTTDDLPPGLGRPARRALHGAGVTSLDDVASRSADELLDLHGLGPKAVQVLAGALAERGQSLR